MLKILSQFRNHLAVFALIGPAFNTVNVDEDSGGVFTYSAAGAPYGYMPLWTLLPITLILIITQERRLTAGLLPKNEVGREHRPSNRSAVSGAVGSEPAETRVAADGWG